MRACRLLTAEDTAAVCHKVTAVLAAGWDLHGSPAHAHDPATGRMGCAQAVVKDVPGDHSPDVNPGEC